MTTPTPHPLGGRYQELVLASTSPARQQLLAATGLPFRAQSPGVDEAVPTGTPTRQAVAMLAERKARAVFNRHSRALVIGADQLVDFQGQALGKPADAAAAHTQLRSLSGTTHSIVTGVCVVGPGYFSCEVDIARLSMVALSDDELQRYVATQEWQGCAGGYRIEAQGQALFSRIDGDRTSVQGLPMLLLLKLLREAGVTFFHPPGA